MKNGRSAYQARLRKLDRESRKREISGDDFFFLAGLPTPDERLEQMRRSAAGLLEWMGKGKPNREGYTEIKRAAKEALRICRVYGFPPPEELERLLAPLLQADRRGRAGRPRDQEKWVKAARYLALHPKASAREVAREVGTSHSSIRAWKQRDPAFRRLAELESL